MAEVKPARAEAQDEGAAGEASAYRVRMISNDPAEWVLMHPEKALDFLSRKGWESQPLYVHPSPTPSAPVEASGSELGFTARHDLGCAQNAIPPQACDCSIRIFKAPPVDARLNQACQSMLDDYQTSEEHHPDHILVRRADFELMASALRPQPSGETREVAFLLDRLADFENDINERDWHGHVAPAVARAKAALSTTPARAEAQDEGAAGERLLAFADDAEAMSVAIAVSNYTGALADDIRSVLSRAHPSPTPTPTPTAGATFFYIRAIAAVVSDQPDTMQADFVSFEDDREAAIGEAMDHFRWLDEQEDQGFPEAGLKDCVLEASGPFPLNPEYVAIP